MRLNISWFCDKFQAYGQSAKRAQETFGRPRISTNQVLGNVLQAARKSLKTVFTRDWCIGFYTMQSVNHTDCLDGCLLGCSAV
jgi:hypothetical protein